ncbi:MAG: hypothetical protein WCL21_07475 [Mariniphaga sp.]
MAVKLILKILYENYGTAISVPDAEINDSLQELARLEGMFVAREGASLWAALKRLKSEKRISSHEKIVLINTGTGYKYPENNFAGENI